MTSHAHFLTEIEAVKPSIELGAFEALWSEGVSSFKQLRDKLRHSHTDLLSDLVSHDLAESFYHQATKRLCKSGVNHFGVVLEGTLDYPEKLRDAEHPVALLYYQGNLDLLFTRSVSVVGTRQPSVEGVKRAKKLVKDLVAEGFTIYSGLAAGIDTAAHQTAIECGGKTVAVIGTPLWFYYPLQNKLLQDKIATEHLLISQVPVVSYKENDIKSTRMFFPERNKTMSALTEATIIVEAGETSGTLIQAKAALKQGRKVFILNNNFENPSLKWPHQLYEGGAIRVHQVDDILQGLSVGNNKVTKN